MAEAQKRKLSPAQFLAELKVRSASPAPPARGAESADAADLDFSDLDAKPSPSVAVAKSVPSAKKEGGEAPQKPERPHSNGHKPADPETAEAQVSPKNRNDNGLMRRKREAMPDVVRGNAQLSELFERVNHLLGDGEGDRQEAFRPIVPKNLAESRLTEEDVERLVLKFLLSRGSGAGRLICSQLCLPFPIVDPILKQLKSEQLLVIKGSAEVGDYEFAITEYGRERARRYAEECTYFGSAPVSLHDYLRAMAAQSIAKQEATEDDLARAFSDLIISPKMLERLGPAINSGRGMFLFGSPGNGKTSIAERVTRSFGSTIWIPRTLGIDGDIIRLFDPGVHEVVETTTSGGIFDLSGIDQRWVQIVRPTILAGGELTMSELEVVQNQQTKICEAPLQLKSNCGTLVIDDFGRQTMPVDVLLNRWIVPLEKRYDFLNLPSGKKVQVPFDQLIIFSTNLEPRDLVDDAFLRRIPYKIEVPNPTEADFRKLFELMSPPMGFEYDKDAVDYLIAEHYLKKSRPFRACQPRDLLLQVRNYCIYKRMPKKLSPSGFDFAVENYFSVM